MKPLKNPKKTVKVLYLYMTLPLLIVAAALWVTTLTFSSDEVADEMPAATKALTVDNVDAGAAASMFCADENDCAIGERCIEGESFNPLVDAIRTMEASRHDPPPKVTPADDGISSAGWAAIIASIMGGLTGLLGAVTQTVLAFLAVRGRRRSRD